MLLHYQRTLVWLATASIIAPAAAQQMDKAPVLSGRQPLAKTAAPAISVQRNPNPNPNQADPEKWQPLSKTVPLPDLPEFTGKKKLIQASTQTTGSQPSYVYVYVTAEDVKQVKDWYEKSLAAYSWKIGRKTDTNIEAKNKDGNDLTMLFVHNPDEAMPTRFSIRYCPHQ